MDAKGMAASAFANRRPAFLWALCIRFVIPSKAKTHYEFVILSKAKDPLSACVLHRF